MGKPGLWKLRSPYELFIIKPCCPHNLLIAFPFLSQFIINPAVLFIIQMKSPPPLIKQCIQPCNYNLSYSLTHYKYWSLRANLLVIVANESTIIFPVVQIKLIIENKHIICALGNLHYRISREKFEPEPG